ncbi:MAG: DUF2244 domain-containing protein [Pseudomonadota bacterium]
MIQVSKSAPKSDAGPSWRIHVSPNRSMDRTAALKVFTAISVMCLAAAGFFALQGLWVPLPLAGAELAALGYCWWLVLRSGERQQIIELDPGQVQVMGEMENFRASFNPHWVRVERGAAVARGHPRRLWLTSHGNRVEVGSFLTEDERNELQGQLTATLGALRSC